MFKNNIRNENGFTLLEVLIVMVILAMLAALVGPPVLKRLAQSRTQDAKTQISLLEGALEMYKLDTRKFPTTEQGLKALREKPSDVARWKGPYLKKELPMDPWGNPYKYKCPSQHGDYEIVSFGLDGVPGGEDENMDVFNWKDLES